MRYPSLRYNVWHFITAVALGAVLALALSVQLHAASQLSGATTCPSSGNKPLSTSSTPFSFGTVQSLSTNAGVIYLGGLTVTSSQGIALNPLGSYTYQAQGNSNPYNLTGVFFACSNSSDAVTWTVTR